MIEFIKAQRHIEFRVRSTTSKHIVGYETLFPTEIDNSQYAWARSGNGTDWTPGVFEGKDLVREQFTGLYDKKGVKIFEEDIVQYGRGKSKQNGWIAFKPDLGSYGLFISNAWSSSLWAYQQEVESAVVLGDVYLDGDKHTCHGPVEKT